MPKKELKTKCLLCNSEYTRTGMARHLKSCLAKEMEQKTKAAKQEFFHIQVSGYGSPQYWMHLKVAANASLEDLDHFLRQIWLECCGHMSAFRDKNGELDMDKKIKTVFKPGMELIHEYDFGSTTTLLIKVFDIYKEAAMKGKPIQILARNTAPEIICDECGKSPAVEICTECQWDDRGWLCKSCAKKHICGEDMLLPVVNSPRTGVCGYTG